MRGKPNHHPLSFSRAVLPLPQHRKCPGFKRPPAEDDEEAGRRAETQGTGELCELPWWVSPAALVSSPFPFAILPAVLCPEYAGQPAGHALGRAVDGDGSQSQAAHVVSAAGALVAADSFLLGGLLDFMCALSLLTLGRAIDRESALP